MPTAMNSNGIAEIEKKYGKGSIQLMGATPIVACPVISTKLPALDSALGVLGIPKGRIIEIFGPESSGKTTLALHIVACTQATGATVAYVDAEHALDPGWAKKIGVNLDNLLISQPDTGEQALDICDILVSNETADLVVVDSVAALIPKSELEGEIGDSHIGLQARLMSQALRMLTGKLYKSNSNVIFINQIREKIGGMSFGGNETTPGGRALKFYASVRMDIRRIGALKEGEKNIGNQIRVRIAKNKVAPPFKDAELKLYFGNPVAGFDVCENIVDYAVKYAVITKSGSWLNYGSTRLGMGPKNAAEFLRNNKDVADEILQKVNVLANGPAVSNKTDLSSEPDSSDSDEEPAA